MKKPNFPIKAVRYNFYSEKDIDNPDYIKHYCDYLFAHGKQTKIESEEKSITKTAGYIPFNLSDYIKHVIVRLVPSLNFGWLTPKYKELKVTFEYTENNTYYNVIPVSSDVKDHVVRFVEYTTGHDVPKPISEVEWLTGEPPTLKDRERSRKEYQKKSFI